MAFATEGYMAAFYYIRYVETLSGDRLFHQAITVYLLDQIGG